MSKVFAVQVREVVQPIARIGEVHGNTLDLALVPADGGRQPICLPADATCMTTVAHSPCRHGLIPHGQSLGGYPSAANAPGDTCRPERR